MTKRNSNITQLFSCPRCKLHNKRYQSSVPLEPALPTSAYRALTREAGAAHPVCNVTWEAGAAHPSE